MLATGHLGMCRGSQARKGKKRWLARPPQVVQIPKTAQKEGREKKEGKA